MTAEQFNRKYNDYLEKGHYGLDIHDRDFISWLDTKFESFIKKDGFKYFQIKDKFGFGRFYADGLSIEEIDEVEDKITSLYKK